MLKEKDLLICDMAQFYHVLDISGLPVRLLATLAAGLPSSSRSRQRMNGAKATDELLLLAVIADNLRLLVWQNTADGSKGVRQPPKILSFLLPTGEKQNETLGFNSAEEFEAERKKLLEEGMTYD